uniref:WRKY domain-containing protein n=1 Tax=Araucaria cunninghamii TaxID=56994 RepID=A0A0D6R4C9_ARACU
MFHFPPVFQSPEAALLGKAKYFQMDSEASKQEVQKQETQQYFEPADFLVLNDDESDESSSQEILVKPEEDRTPSPRVVSPEVSGLQSGKSVASQPQTPNANPSSQNNKKRKSERAVRYAFKTRSESDILEDGYKWRKYGKKFVKNSPNPRNYYRCSYSNCSVKKRVERDAQDNGVVITTYEGKHNHESPTVIYYIGKPSMVLPQQVSSFEPYPPLCYPTHHQADFMFLNNS